MFKIIQSASISGASSIPVSIEVSASTGLPQETIIGLPDTVIKESRSRVKSAIILAGFDFPAMAYVINLTPTDVPKKNISLELGICAAILSITNQITIPDNACFIGGLSLDGTIVPIRHILPIIYYFPDYKTTTFIIAKDNESDISPLDGIQYIPVGHLNDLKDIHNSSPKQVIFTPPKHHPHTSNFDDVSGHFLAKQACAFSIIGRHPLLFVGSPGVGKTMLIDRMPSLMPPLTNQQALDNCCLELLMSNHMSYHSQPPYRSPHHSISYAGMIGGKNPPQPGEITRANHGLLFLDEIGEYQRAILETLREPLETKRIQLSRAGHSATFSADFLLATAMNPCYCGNYYSFSTPCRCLPNQIIKYWQKISQPFLDRLSICMVLSPSETDTLTVSQSDLLAMVNTGQAIAKSRNPNGSPNHDLDLDTILSFSQLSTQTETLMNQYFTKYQSSMRAKKRIYQLARTIADSNNESSISTSHASMALQLSQHHLLPLHGSKHGIGSLHRSTHPK